MKHFLRRFLALSLTLLVLVTAVPATVSASDQVQASEFLVIPSGISPNNEFTVTVMSPVTSTNISIAEFNLEFDTTYFELTNLVDSISDVPPINENDVEGSYRNINTDGIFNISHTDVSSRTSYTAGTTVFLKATFKAKSYTFAEGETQKVISNAFKVTDVIINDGSYRDITPAGLLTDGKVTLDATLIDHTCREGSKWYPGGANGTDVQKHYKKCEVGAEQCGQLIPNTGVNHFDTDYAWGRNCTTCGGENIPGNVPHVHGVNNNYTWVNGFVGDCVNNIEYGYFICTLTGPNGEKCVSPKFKQVDSANPQNPLPDMINSQTNVYTDETIKIPGMFNPSVHNPKLTSESVEKMKSTPPTCTTNGMPAYYMCGNCNNAYFEDVQFKKPITDLTAYAAQYASTHPEFAAMGHDYQWKFVTDAEATDLGIQNETYTVGSEQLTYKDVHFRLCTRCNVFETTIDGETQVAQVPPQKHTPPANVNTQVEDTICTVCNYVMAEATGHITCANPKGNTAREVLATNATCVSGSVGYHWECTVIKENGQECGEWYKDAYCTMPIADKSSIQGAPNLQNHVDENGNSITQLEHVARIEPTCAEVGWVEHYTCPSCEVKFEDQEGKALLIGGELPKTTEHTGPISYSWESADAEKHYNTCNECLQVTTPGGEPHSIVNDATGRKVCEICRYVVAMGVCPHSSNSLTEVPAVAATCTTSGTRAYWLCDEAKQGCGKMFREADCLEEITTAPVLPKLEHSLRYTECATGHTSECTRIGCNYRNNNVEAHSGNRDNPTVTDPVKCLFCGYVMVPATGSSGNNGVSISGIVKKITGKQNSVTTGSVLANATVKLYSVTLNNGEETLTQKGTMTTGADGSYAFSNVGNGTYRLEVSANGCVTRKYDITVSGIGVTTEVMLTTPGDVTLDGRLDLNDLTAACYLIADIGRTNIDEYGKFVANINENYYATGEPNIMVNDALWILRNLPA